MHYIRLLRPAKFSAESHDIELLVTVTTDLGDSFLAPSAPVDLVATAERPDRNRLLGRARAFWSAGLRVLRIRVPVGPRARPADVSCVVRIHPAAQHGPPGAVRSADVVRAGPRQGQELVVPASVEMVAGVGSPVSLRALELRDSRPLLLLEEDVGESIARHVWDAGIVTAFFLSDVDGDALAAALPVRRDRFCVLELGCGIGVLGIAVARVVRRTAAAQGRELAEAVVLLTDLPEAEERARANIARAVVAESESSSTTPTETEQNNEVATSPPLPPAAELQYENLDWDEGRHGHFGPLASAQAWDLVVLSDCTYNADSLPALVGTLSAVHAANLGHPDFIADVGARTSVLLATKPRHASEQALFGLLEADGWGCRVLESVPLPRVGGEDEVVEIYMLEKDKPA
ncbi:putative methyltransferase-domain-containing protein [Hypoxylon sp. FL1284]|nr:putative methyltransferase-domain-containing protein [Hypoxylon sp. FL1284]